MERILKSTFLFCFQIIEYFYPINLQEALKYFCGLQKRFAEDLSEEQLVKFKTGWYKIIAVDSEMESRSRVSMTWVKKRMLRRPTFSDRSLQGERRFGTLDWSKLKTRVAKKRKVSVPLRPAPSLCFQTISIANRQPIIEQSASEGPIFEPVPIGAILNNRWFVFYCLLRVFRFSAASIRLF